MTNEHAGHRQVTIIVNARRIEWSSRQISYDEVYELAFPNQPLGEGDTATIEYSRGAHGHGSLNPGRRVEVAEGMTFDVRRTHRDVDVKVTFATADRPYRHEYAVGVTVGTVLGDSLTAFGVAADGTTRYYLKHDGDELPADKTVGEIAGRGRALHLKLRTETIQGAS